MSDERFVPERRRTARSVHALIGALGSTLMLLACGGSSKDDTDSAADGAGLAPPLDDPGSESVNLPISTENDSGGAGSALPSGPIDVEMIGVSRSPLPDTTGVLARIDPDTRLYLLESDRAGVEALTVNAVPDLTGGDMSEVVGGAFLSFEGFEAESGQIVIESERPLLSVVECDAATRDCEIAPYEPLPDGSIVVEVSTGRYYALHGGAER